MFGFWTAVWVYSINNLLYFVHSCKTRNIGLAGKRPEDDVNFKRATKLLEKRPRIWELFEKFSAFWDVWLPGVVIWLNVGHCQTRNVGLPGNDRKNVFKLSSPKENWCLVRKHLFQSVFVWEVWLSKNVN